MQLLFESVAIIGFNFPKEIHNKAQAKTYISDTQTETPERATADNIIHHIDSCNISPNTRQSGNIARDKGFLFDLSLFSSASSTHLASTPVDEWTWIEAQFLVWDAAGRLIRFFSSSKKNVAQRRGPFSALRKGSSRSVACEMLLPSPWTGCDFEPDFNTFPEALDQWESVVLEINKASRSSPDCCCCCSLPFQTLCRENNCEWRKVHCRPAGRLLCRRSWPSSSILRSTIGWEFKWLFQVQE